MIAIEGEIRTVHAHPELVAAAICPDNLMNMSTVAEGRHVVTRIRDSRLRSVIASVDDYLTNLAVAEDLCGPGSG
jgi:hypothetical protein